MNDFLKYIKSRGYLHQCTNEAGVTQALKKSTSGYIGFDCTSDSLHAESLLPYACRVFKIWYKPSYYLVVEQH